MAELGISSTKEKDKMAFLAAIKGLREKDKAKREGLGDTAGPQVPTKDVHGHNCE